jgi:hypothetical protein
MKKPKPITKTITITMEGGIIQHIAGIPLGVRVKILDFDTDGVEAKKLTLLPNGQKAVVSIWNKS